MKKWFLVLIAGLICAEEPAPKCAPWFTGTLLAPTGSAVPFGEFEIEPYVYFTNNTGIFNNEWESVSVPHKFFSINSQFLCIFGLTPWMDILILPQFFWNTTQGRDSTQFGDLRAALDFQLYGTEAHPYFPGIKLTVQESFPTGKFQRLSPSLFRTDSVGTGSFETTFGLVLYKIYTLVECRHWMSLTLSGVYTVASSVYVHGLHAYGSGDGTVSPGSNFWGSVDLEFTLNQNWVFAFDFIYSHTDKSKFRDSGHPFPSSSPSSFAPGAAVPLLFHSSEQFSFAPGIEYNFSSNLGIIAGCWFTAWGRNSTQFRSGVIAFYYGYGS